MDCECSVQTHYVLSRQEEEASWGGGGVEVADAKTDIVSVRSDLF